MAQNFSGPFCFRKYIGRVGVKKVLLFFGLTFLSVTYLESKLMRKFTLSSSAFQNGQEIPAKYTCQGADISPDLSWKDAPANTKSFALIVDDPDAQKVAGKVWVHWVVYNIGSNIKSLPENIKSGDFSLGLTDFGKKEWGGPCPPTGKHEYVFTLYALDIKLDLAGDVDKEKLLSAIENHVISQTRLIGYYQKK